ncbi:IPT/TIG domain-containing protein [Hymenobacter monticola]|uniref:IPT/TIG domain-containing protein n=1 Tax=Hymenobacter monticola TaxID=1705399 RepID=A0ABY4AZZ7_9BACT|nr:IPT/TIG domain-containing protein [Hymenobacter monticola]UOE32099.1 IPT/TIG domain-containing protein [Hymenobacter monticola]
MAATFTRILKGNFKQWAAAAALLLAAPAAHAQENCLLVPVPLAERLARAVWVVEAEASAPAVVQDGQGHLLRRYGLKVFKVFRAPGGAVPTALLLPGGQLGDRREEVSYAPKLPAGQQGIFFLEADPQHPGEWRLFAGPQGLIRYDLARRTAAEPFGSYPAIATDLYAALRNPAEAAGYRVVQANAALATPVAAARVAGTAAITSFSPSAVPAGTGAVLTITGSNFGATRGTGSVQFLNADDGGASRVQPLDSDYLSWTDTEIRVQVPSTTPQGSPAGTGPVVVANSAGVTSTSAGPLTISYGIINLESSGATPTALRPKLTNDNGSGGYTLAYVPAFQANAAAVAAFERALTQWGCNTGANRVTTTTTATAVPGGASTDGTNIVTFDATPATLPAGVLGVTYSYYRLCGTNVTVPETDYVFANRADWNYGPQAPASAQYDFESVALHEQGHGIQMAHVINTNAVMHYNIGNGQSKRVLGLADDIAGGRAEVQFSTSTNTAACGTAPGVHVPVAITCNTSLPVTLVSFAASHEKGIGTRLRWATAMERNSAWFAVEAQEEGTADWKEVARQAAAGNSGTPRSYEARDPRLLSGTRYYRLRQIDLDGTVAFSPLVAVAAPEAALAFYPNPTKGRLHLPSQAQARRLRVLDLAGREVTSFVLAPGPAEIDLVGLQPGLYLLEWADSLGLRWERLLKQ